MIRPFLCQLCRCLVLLLSRQLFPAGSGRSFPPCVHIHGASEPAIRVSSPLKPARPRDDGRSGPPAARTRIRVPHPTPDERSDTCIPLLRHPRPNQLESQLKSSTWLWKHEFRSWHRDRRSVTIIISAMNRAVAQLCGGGAAHGAQVHLDHVCLGRCARAGFGRSRYLKHRRGPGAPRLQHNCYDRWHSSLNQLSSSHLLHTLLRLSVARD